jgi:hypothetical protein
MLLKVANVIATSAAIILALAWFALNYLETNPRNPNSQEDGIVPHAVKAIIAPISESQQNFLSWLISIVIGSGLINEAVILINGRILSNRKGKWAPLDIQDCDWITGLAPLALFSELITAVH